MRIRGLPILNKMFSKITKQNADKIFLISFLLLGSIQFLILQNNPFDLSPDETHYWEWSKRLDLSYYSKGPLIAYLIRIGTAIFGDTELGVRFPSFVLHQIFLICFYLFARRLYSPGIAVSVWFAVRAMLIFSQMGMLMTTDAPAALSWLLALMAIYEVIVEKRKDAWIYFSLAVGVGILAKYTVASLYLSVLLIFIFAGLSKVAGVAFVPVSVGFTIFMFFLELLVAAIQAFIFTNLTAVFIGQAIEEHHHDDDHGKGHH